MDVEHQLQELINNSTYIHQNLYFGKFHKNIYVIIFFSCLVNLSKRLDDQPLTILEPNGPNFLTIVKGDMFLSII